MAIEDAAAEKTVPRRFRKRTRATAAPRNETLIADAANKTDLLMGAATRYRGLYRLAEGADDLAQDALEKAIRASHTYDPLKGSVDTWLRRIVHNTAIDHQRREAVRFVNMDRIGREVHPDPVVEPEQEDGGLRDATAQLHACIELLPEEQRVAIRLSMQDVPQAQMAAAWGVPLGTVKSRIRIGQEKLKRLLDERGITGEGLFRNAE